MIGRRIAVLGTALAIGVSGVGAAKQIELDVSLGTPVVIEGQRQPAYLRVAMTGFKMEEDLADRAPVNVAIVLDKSGSMQTGNKMEKAREAAIMAIERLKPNDIVSVVAYDKTVQVLVPATKVSDRDLIRQAIRNLQAGGNTALFAGVSKGAQEVRKFLEKNRVNRVILLSDGKANVGPSSPADLAQLGGSLISDGISVTTIGLGLDYNEDLMAQLAERSDGNHIFAETATDLAEAFDSEFGDVLSVVAQDVSVTIMCPKGIRPVRVLGRSADIVGQTITTSLNQLYSEHMKYVLVEVELPPGKRGEEMNVASVEITYANMDTKTTDRLSSTVSVGFTDSTAVVDEKTNTDVMVAAVHQTAVDVNKQALQLRDEGKIEEAAQVLNSNASMLWENADKYQSKELDDYARFNHVPGGSNVLYGDWQRTRKAMREEQHKIVTQQKATNKE